MSAKSSYVIDTNVILHDPRAIYSFPGSNIIIPMAVLEEIDTFKNGNEQKNINARIFIRDIEASESDLLSLGVYDIENKINDDRILFAASAAKATLVTKDISLRIRARAKGIDAIDYNEGKVEDLNDLNAGYKIIKNVDDEVIESLYQSKSGIDPFMEVVNNEYYLLEITDGYILTKYNAFTKKIEVVSSHTCSNISAKNIEQQMALDALLDPNIPLVALNGIAGSGKTLLAIAAAIAQKQNYRQIFISRPTVDMERSIGFLPGEMNDKLRPYMEPIFDNIKVIRESYKTEKSQQAIDKLITENKIKIEALNFIRGRSLPKIFFIVDEAQNCTPKEIKTIITRAGEGTKIIFTGDIYQIDTPYLDAGSNGLTNLIHSIHGQKLFAHVNLVRGERSELAELAAKVL